MVFSIILSLMKRRIYQSLHIDYVKRMTDSQQSEQCFLSITCEGENDIIDNILMCKRNLILPSHEYIRTTCLGSDVADLADVENFVNNVAFYEAVTTEHHKVING